MSIRKLDVLQQELQKLSEEGATVQFTKEESQILDIENAYDLLEESEAVNG